MRAWVLILLFMVLAVSPGFAVAQCTYTGTGDWVINTSETCADDIVDLNGNLIVENIGNLTLDNVTLRVNATSNGGIRIENNGSLYIADSEINSSSGFAYLFWVNPGSNFSLEDSHVHKVGYSSTDLGRSGLYILSSNSKINGSVMTNNYMGAVLKDTSGCLVNNSVFGYNVLYDLFLLSSENVLITNTNYNTLVRNWYLDVKVVDTGGSPVQNAGVVITDVYNSVLYSGNTPSSGSIPTQIVKETFENKSGSDRNYNPYRINVTKSGYLGNVTYVNVTGDLLKNMVNREVNITQNVSIAITVKSPGNNSVYLKSDLVNDTLLGLEVETNVNASYCDYMIDSIVGSLSEINPRNFKKYLNVSAFTNGGYAITFLCGDNATENTIKVLFSLYPKRECLMDGDCADDEECGGDYECVKLSCTCGYASNHQCVYYECCADNACEETEFCDTVQHICKNVQCDCGVVRNHQCVFPYSDYCCENAHCDENQTCDIINHKCVTQILSVYVPESIIQGETIKVYVRDQNNDSVAGAKVTVTYSDSGNMYIFSTNTQGLAEIPINESGNVQISARKQNYFTGATSFEVTPAFDWFLFSMIFVVIFVAILVPVLLFKKRGLFKLGSLIGPLKLEKTTSGRLAMLIIKNKTGGILKLLSVVDHVPKGGFIRCNLTPQIETVNQTTDRLRWTVLELRPKEEVVIEYEARGFYKGFLVEFGGKRYEG